MIEALCPPKPKVADIAASTFISIPLLYRSTESFTFAVCRSSNGSVLPYFFSVFSVVAQLQKRNGKRKYKIKNFFIIPCPFDHRQDAHARPIEQLYILNYRKSREKPVFLSRRYDEIVLYFLGIMPKRGARPTPLLLWKPVILR